jgi:hypothetical protein
MSEEMAEKLGIRPRHTRKHRHRQSRVKVAECKGSARGPRVAFCVPPFRFSISEAKDEGERRSKRQGAKHGKQGLVSLVSLSRPLHASSSHSLTHSTPSDSRLLCLEDVLGRRGGGLLGQIARHRLIIIEAKI